MHRFSLGAIRAIRPGRAPVPADVGGQEGTDWLQLLWNFVASLVAPDEEEEGIHQLTETLTRKGASPHPSIVHHLINIRINEMLLAGATSIFHDRNVRSNLSTNVPF